jgi:hypothetical protein
MKPFLGTVVLPGEIAAAHSMADGDPNDRQANDTSSEDVTGKWRR